MNLSSIAQGWFNTVLDSIGLLPDGVKQKVEQRLKQCAGCEFRIKDTIDRCAKCSCPIVAKIRSFDKDNKCPINKW